MKAISTKINDSTYDKLKEISLSTNPKIPISDLIAEGLVNYIIPKYSILNKSLKKLVVKLVKDELKSSFKGSKMK